MPLRHLLLGFAILHSTVSQMEHCIADSGPYCGIYAVYGAASAVGVSADFQELLNPQFVSSRGGSTVDDLVIAARHLGLTAQAFTGLGLSSLLESSDPLILHVASFGQLDFYNHWLLFLGMEEGKARTVDGNGAVFLMHPAELLARWDGVGIVIRHGSRGRMDVRSVETASAALWGLIVILTLFGTSFVVNRFLTALYTGGVSWIPIVVLSTAALIAIRESRSDLSLWRNPDCVRFIMAAEGHRTFPDLSTSELAELIGHERDLLIYDTRYNGDMAYGHIPGALALPVDSTQQQVSEIVAGLDRDRTVVLYCQSHGCHFSDRMAIVLSGFGFDDIRIYRDGWKGWHDAHATGAPEK